MIILFISKAPGRTIMLLFSRNNLKMGFPFDKGTKNELIPAGASCLVTFPSISISNVPGLTRNASNSIWLLGASVPAAVVKGLDCMVGAEVE